jgi:hypothetical protein
MRKIESNRDLSYYKMMYRRAVNVSCGLVILMALLVIFLFYAYAQRPERAFYASSKSYKITRLQPLN